MIPQWRLQRLRQLGVTSTRLAACVSPAVLAHAFGTPHGPADSAAAHDDCFLPYPIRHLWRNTHAERSAREHKHLNPSCSQVHVKPPTSFAILERRMHEALAFHVAPLGVQEPLAGGHMYEAHANLIGYIQATANLPNAVAAITCLARALHRHLAATPLPRMPSSYLDIEHRLLQSIVGVIRDGLEPFGLSHFINASNNEETGPLFNATSWRTSRAPPDVNKLFPSTLCLSNYAPVEPSHSGASAISSLNATATATSADFISLLLEAEARGSSRQAIEQVLRKLGSRGHVLTGFAHDTACVECRDIREKFESLYVETLAL